MTTLCRICANAEWTSLGSRQLVPSGCEYDQPAYGKVQIPSQCPHFTSRRDWPKAPNNNKPAKGR